MSAPAQIVAGFQATVDKTMAYHAELMVAVSGKKRQAALESILCEQCVMTVGVQWEAFITNLVVAYVVKSPKRCLDQLKVKAVQSLKEKFGKEVSKHIAFQFPPALSERKALGIIDPRHFNLSHQNAEILSRRANELLDAPYAIKFALAQEHADFLDYFIALRNHIAHRSPASRSSLRTAIERLNGVNAELSAALRTPGSYLKVRPGGTESRTDVVCRRSKEVAGLLV